MPDFTLQQHADYWIGSFQAMASPCDIIIDTEDKNIAFMLTQLAQREALRIHNKFSRYQTNNDLWKINNAQSAPIRVDAETAQLLEFAQLCFTLSEGLFDITSGCLRRAWKFDGSNNLPASDAVEMLKPFVGWQKIRWENPTIQMPAGMEIDFGGIGKEYAVDRVMQLLSNQTNCPLLVNFGGDLAVNGTRKNNIPWQVGIEIPDREKEANKILEISAGALATSGDSRRFLLVGEKRYSHILNPFTGYPVEGAPRSVTVAGSNCTQAGMLASFASLKGKDADAFLAEQGAPYWILW